MSGERIARSWPSGDGDTARRIRELDWSATPLGPIQGWSQSLLTTVDLMLGADGQIVLFCGPQFVALYNDAYAPTIGLKHPRALGRPAREHWTELWSDLEPLLKDVMETGKTFSAKDRPFYIERSGFGETVYFDVSYSAVRRPDGSVEAVLCLVTETTERVRAVRALQESEARFRALVNASSDVVYRMSADWIEMRRLDGRGFLSDTTNPIVKWLDEYVLPADQPEIRKAIDTAVRTRGTFELEHRVRRADGTEGWTFSRAVPIIDADDNIVEWFGMASDVTARVMAHQQERFLYNELNHRMKNLFAMVQAIAKLTLRNIYDRDAAKALEDRLLALSGAHDILLGNNWLSAPIAEIAQAACVALGMTERISLSGPDLVIGPKASLSLSLLLHELGTNAVKHGALSGAEGVVDLKWGIDEDGKTFRLVWTERGGPQVKGPGQKSFGTRVISTGLSPAGKVQLTFDPAGVVAEISAPLADLHSSF